MKKLLFLVVIVPSVSFADRLGALRSGSDVALTTQTALLSSTQTFTGSNTFLSTSVFTNGISTVNITFTPLPINSGFGPQVSDPRWLGVSNVDSGVGATFTLRSSTYNNTNYQHIYGGEIQMHPPTANTGDATIGFALGPTGEIPLEISSQAVTVSGSSLNVTGYFQFNSTGIFNDVTSLNSTTTIRGPFLSTSPYHFVSSGTFDSTSLFQSDVVINAKLGISTGTIPGDIGFGGDSNRQISVNENTTTHGSTITIKAGAGNTGVSNRNGGSVIISGGNSTGTGSSLIEFRTAGSGASGTTVGVPARRAWFNEYGGFCFGSGACALGSSPQYSGFDVSYGGAPSTLTLGAENNLATRTNNTAKVARLVLAPYGFSQNPVTLLIGSANSSTSVLNWGGGSSIVQPVTQQDFYTGTYGGTTGTSRLTINSSGNVIVSTGAFYIGTTAPGVFMSSTGYSSFAGPFTVVGGSVTLTGLVSQSTTTMTGGFSFFSRTIAQLNAMTPANVGQTYYCSNCAQQAICVSTGTGQGAFTSPHDKATHCN